MLVTRWKRDWGPGPVGHPPSRAQPVCVSSLEGSQELASLRKGKQQLEHEVATGTPGGSEGIGCPTHPNAYTLLKDKMVDVCKSRQSGGGHESFQILPREAQLVAQATLLAKALVSKTREWELLKLSAANMNPELKKSAEMI
eukprot:Em0006g655a